MKNHRPLYLNTKTITETERLDRTANEYRDYWLLALGIVLGVIAFLIL